MGTNGANGKNCFTTVNSSYIQPTIGSAVVVTVLDTSWMAVGEVIFVQTGGYYLVTVIGSSTSVTISNDAQWTGFNRVAGQTITPGSLVTPGGLRGVAGSSGASTLNGISPTTSKGDIIVDNGANNPTASDVRLPVGSDGKVFTASSSQPTGVGWFSIDLFGIQTSFLNQLPIGRGGTGQATTGPAFDALSPMTTNGDLITRAAGVNSRIGIGSSGQILTVVGGAPAWATGVSSVLQLVQVSTAAHSTQTSTIPLDDTIPQSSEGTQILTVNITPSNNTSRLVVTGVMQFGLSQADQVIVSLFNGGTNAIAAWSDNFAGGLGQMSFVHEFVPGSTSPLTMAVRMGDVGGNQLDVNGISGGRLFGGVQRCWMLIAEYA
jgi:hypothetical protein